MTLAKKLQLKDQPVRWVGAPKGFKLDAARASAANAPLLAFASNKAELKPYEAAIETSA